MRVRSMGKSASMRAWRCWGRTSRRLGLHPANNVYNWVRLAAGGVRGGFASPRSSFCAPMSGEAAHRSAEIDILGGPATLQTSRRVGDHVGREERKPIKL